MNKSNIKHFKYTKANGETSNRTAYILHGASDLTLAIDLSEFEEEEQYTYEEIIDDIRKDFYEAIRQAGLGGNIRTFKEDNMIELEKIAKLAGEVI